jgi:HD-GYP domain-containing protein (c-di-GMP phosphodiesterase class II)
LRPYREPLPTEHACEELRRHAGAQSDPDCVEALLDLLEDAAASNRTPATAA